MTQKILQSMRDLFRFKTRSLDPKTINARAQKLTTLGSRHAFRMFRDQKFRTLMKFGAIAEEEQNRIFNELVVTNLMIFMLMLDQWIKEAEGDRSQCLTMLREAVPLQFIADLTRMGIQKEFIAIWQKLINLRYEEYEQSTLEVRGEFLKHDDPEIREFGYENRVMAFQAVAIGSCHHLVRGNADWGSEVYKNGYRDYLLRFANVLLKAV